MSQTPTAEQTRVIESESNYLLVNAAAGTGKTSTLVRYAKARPRARMMYIAFNKSIRKEATLKFGRDTNVTCVTSHSLAWGAFGRRFEHKLVPKLHAYQAADALSLRRYGDDFALFLADHVLRAIDRFLASNDDDFDEPGIERRLATGSDVDAKDIADLARILWDKMCNPSDMSIGMVHDGYLKLYALSRPALEFDRILFDEAQDANPVTTGLIESQTCPIVAVGDQNQSLYAFRGAKNALRKFSADETLYLTKSFRFGQGIADVANAVLQSMKGEQRRLTGTDHRSEIGPFDRRLPHAFIARANATLFDEAARLVTEGRRVGFVGGIEGYRMGEVLDVYKLWSGARSEMRNPHLKSFRSFDKLEEYGGAVDDKEVKSLVNAIKRHGSKVPKLVRDIREGTSEDRENVEVFLSTPHKAKGLEFPNVRLADDFMDLLDEKGAIRKIGTFDEEEVNGIYVAATRAEERLAPFPQLEALLALSQKKKNSEKLPEWARPPGSKVWTPSKR